MDKYAMTGKGIADPGDLPIIKLVPVLDAPAKLDPFDSLGTDRWRKGGFDPGSPGLDFGIEFFQGLSIHGTLIAMSDTLFPDIDIKGAFPGAGEG